MDTGRLGLIIGATALLAAVGGSVALARTAPPRTAEPGQDVVLGSGEEVSLAGQDFTVRYQGLDSDSRCPPQRLCFASGDAVVTVTLATPGRGGRASAQLHTGQVGPRETGYRAKTVRLVDVSPGGDQITLRIAE